MKLLIVCVCFGLAVLLTAASSEAQEAVFQTAVAPLPDEDLAGDCRYEMTLPDPSRTVRGVWVIFDRGRDMLRTTRIQTFERSLDDTTGRSCCRFTVAPIPEPTAAAIPQFILAGSTDRITGTERPYAYFRRHFDRGAPWTFVVLRPLRLSGVMVRRTRGVVEIGRSARPASSAIQILQQQ